MSEHPRTDAAAQQLVGQQITGKKFVRAASVIPLADLAVELEEDNIHLKEIMAAAVLVVIQMDSEESVKLYGILARADGRN